MDRIGTAAASLSRQQNGSCVSNEPATQPPPCRYTSRGRFSPEGPGGVYSRAPKSFATVRSRRPTALGSPSMELRNARARSRAARCASFRNASGMVAKSGAWSACSSRNSRTAGFSGARSGTVSPPRWMPGPQVRRRLDVELKEKNVAVLDHVLLALRPQQACLLNRLLTAEAEQVVGRVGLCANEAALKVGVDDAGCSRCLGSARDCPGAHLLHPGGEVRNQVQQAVSSVDQPVQPRFSQPKVGEEFAALVGLQ